VDLDGQFKPTTGGAELIHPTVTASSFFFKKLWACSSLNSLYESRWCTQSFLFYGRCPKLEGKGPRGLGDPRDWCQAWTMIKWSDPRLRWVNSLSFEWLTACLLSTLHPNPQPSLWVRVGLCGQELLHKAFLSSRVIWTSKLLICHTALPGAQGLLMAQLIVAKCLQSTARSRCRPDIKDSSMSFALHHIFAHWHPSFLEIYELYIRKQQDNETKYHHPHILLQPSSLPKKQKISSVCFIDFFLSTEIKVQSMTQICLKQETGITLAKLWDRPILGESTS